MNWLFKPGVPDELVEDIYMVPDRCRAESGYLVVFDRDGSKPWDEKLYRRGESSTDAP